MMLWRLRKSTDRENDKGARKWTMVISQIFFMPNEIVNAQKNLNGKSPNGKRHEICVSEIYLTDREIGE
ncbi:hypothetical protein AAKU61_003857 [Undibacterium sp. GrIS 1.2]